MPRAPNSLAAQRVRAFGDWLAELLAQACA